MMAAREFQLMKKTAFLINIGRGACVVLDDLVAALQAGKSPGLAWTCMRSNPYRPSTHSGPCLVCYSPHVAGVGPYLQERRTELLLENCQRFNEGRPLHNVDKAHWF